MDEEKKYIDFINSVFIDIRKFLAEFNLKAKLIKTYDWDSDTVGIYIYRSVANGTMRIGVNFSAIEEFANEYDEEFFNKEEIANENILTTLWHEVGHGLVEHIKRVRRHDTQNGTHIFRGKLLEELRDIVYNEEDVVEEFGEYMAGFDYESKLYNFAMKNVSVLKYGNAAQVSEGKKTIYITEEQRNKIEEAVSKTGKWNAMLNEETGSDRKKVMKIIADNCNRTYCQPYLMTPLSNVPSWLHDMCNPEGQEQGAWISVKNNQHGMNRFIDFLVLNLKGQVGISHGNGPDQYIVGIARVLCQDLGFYSFGENMNGGGIIRFSKLMKMIDKMPEFMLDGEQLDKDLNGMTYQEIMQKFKNRMDAYVNGTKERLANGRVGEGKHYRVVPINDTVNYQGMVAPDASGQNVLSMLDDYTDWCVCGPNGQWEYAQYLSNGGKLYILMKDGFENIPRQQGENCPLDEYGLSLLAIIIGSDGLPDNVTTRWNHEFGGENHSNLWNAEQIQEITGLNYLETFKPRSEQQLRQMHLDESVEDGSGYVKLYHVEDGPRGREEKEFARTGLWLSHFPDDSYGDTAYIYDVPKNLKIADEDTAVSYAIKYNYKECKYFAACCGLDLEDGDEISDAREEFLIDPERFLGENDWAGMLRACGYDGFEFEYHGFTYYYLFDPSVAKLDSKVDCEDWGTLSQNTLEERNDTPSAQDQVHNKVNAGIMDAVTCGGMMEEETIEENSNDRKVNKYIKEKFGLTDFQDIRNKVMEIYEKIPYARINGGRYMLGVLRLLFEENLPREDYGILNKILYKIGNSNYYERQGVNDENLGGFSFEQLKEKYFIPDFEGDDFSTAEKQIKLPNGYTVTRIDTYDEMNARCDGEWCISYDESMWWELTEGETVYLVENEKLIDKFDEYYESHSEECQNIGYAAGEEDDMMEMGFINDNLSWVNKPGSWKFPYDYYGLSRFVVLVGEQWISVYSRYNMPNDFDGDYLTKEQLEDLLGVKFSSIFKYIPKDNTEGYYDNHGRWRLNTAVQEGAEPEADEYKIGGEGGNNEYFHAVNESKIGNFDFKKYFKPIAKFMKEDGLNVYPYPKVKLDWSPQDGLFIKTGYYEPDSKTIVIFCDDRHPKDILRTFCHEMIHHSQNLDGKDLNFSSDDDVKDNERLEKIEAEAYLKGNVYFRKWTEYAKKDSKDVLQEGRKKVVKNDKGEIVPETCPDCGGKVGLYIKGEPVYLCSKCNKYFGTKPSGVDESIDIAKALKQLKKRRDPANIEDWDSINEEYGIDPNIKNGVNINIDENDWVSMILNHEKTIETRPLSAANMWKKHIGETIGLVRTTKNRKDTTGMLVGSAKLVDVVEYRDEKSFAADADKHRVGGEYQVPRCGLVLDDVKEIKPWVRLKSKGQQQVRPIEPYDSINESTDPDDIDLSSFNIKTALNPKFWKDGRLDSRIRMKLLDIADDFIEFLGVDWVKPDDIIMTGSLANYNWNKKFSDIDLHILMDYSKVDKRTDFVSNYFYSQKKLWNEEHKDLKIFGFPVELYVQDTKEKHSSTGVYSLDKDKWLVEPEREKLSKSKINKSLIKNKVAEYIDKIDKLLTIYKKADNDYKIRKVSEKAEALFDKIKGERKSGLDSKDNEITNGNLIFKCLRRMGYIEKISDLMSDTYDKMNSLS